MKRRRIISSYFFQKTCYHGNHIMHSIAPAKSKAIVLLREQVGEIFSNSSSQTCYQERSSKYASLQKFCWTDDRKNLLFDYCLSNFFPTYRVFLKIGIYTHPIDLSRYQNLKKIHRPEAEIIAHEVGKYENVTVDQIPLDACAKLFTRAQSSSHACKTTSFHPDVFFVKGGYFSFRSFHRLQEK